MSLAARCPACGTVFRVVQDQLRVSEGWVRCGRCTEVFNAIENLVDLETDVASLPSTRSPGRERVIEDLARLSGQEEPAEDALSQMPPSRVEAAGPATSPSGPAADDLPATDARATLGVAEATPAPAEVPAAPDWHADSVDAPVLPTFVRRAERAARWRRPGVRALLAGLAAAGAALLAMQAVYTYRDLVAARWPQFHPWLASVCAMTGCRIDAPREIDALVVDSSGLVRLAGTPMYRLSVVLRNRSALALALPSIDLTLTDSQGGVIARRVVALADMGAARADVPAHANLPLQATLRTDGAPVSGYTIEIFYP